MSMFDNQEFRKPHILSESCHRIYDSPRVIVDGICWLFDLEFGGLFASGVGEGEEERGGGTSKLASLVAAAPRHVRVATEQTSARSLASIV